MKFDLNGATVEVPDGWRGVELTVVAPAATGPAPMLAKGAGFRRTMKFAGEPVPEGTTAKGYFDAQVRALREAGSDLKILKAGPLRRTDCDGLWAEIASVGPGGEPLRQLQHILVRGTEVWIAVATDVGDDNWEQARAEIDPLLASFKF